MSASNHNWVCFRCRHAKRQPKSARTIPKCFACGLDLHCLGYKVAVPRKLNLHGWRKLHLDCRKRLLTYSIQQAVQRVRIIHAAERELVRLRSLGPAKGRQKIVRALETQVRL